MWRGLSSGASGSSRSWCARLEAGETCWYTGSGAARRAGLWSWNERVAGGEPGRSAHAGDVPVGHPRQLSERSRASCPGIITRESKHGKSRAQQGPEQLTEARAHTCLARLPPGTPGRLHSTVYLPPTAADALASSSDCRTWLHNTRTGNGFWTKWIAGSFRNSSAITSCSI